jgi:hypothetical protein
MKKPKGGSEHDRMQALIHHHLRRRASFEPPLAASEHLDADALASFTEGRLTETEAKPVISHLIACAFCRHTSARLFNLAFELGDFAGDAPAPNAAPEPGRIRRLLESLAARVLPASDETAVFAYHVHPDEAEEGKSEDEQPEKTKGDEPKQ